MRYFALATDYDGTLAEKGVVHKDTLSALKRLRATGRHVLLVTGRELPDVMTVFPEYAIFERIVAENGALLYDPASKRETVLAQAPPPEFAKTLARKGVNPLVVARVLVATLEDQKDIVLETIRELGLELQLIFNKSSVMVLPSGVNKATGLKAALQSLCLSLHNTVAVGDAENDHALLHACERGIAVSNALPSLKETSDWVTIGSAGAGVSELIQRLVADDLESLPAKDRRDALLVGEAEGGEIRLPYGETILVADRSGERTSAFTIVVMRRLMEARYQFCAMVTRGDYSALEGAVVLGESKRAPAIDEILNVLREPKHSLIVNLTGLGSQERSAFLESAVPRIQEMRARTGRPHWVIMDESLHLAPAGAMLLTSRPDRVPDSVLAGIDAVIAMGAKSDEIIDAFCSVIGKKCPKLGTEEPPSGQALLCSRKSVGKPILFTVVEASSAREQAFSSRVPQYQTPG